MVIMTRASFISKEFFSSLLVGLLPISVYGVVLAVHIPYAISHPFVHYSLLYFLLILILYYLSFRVKSKYDWLLGACLTAFIFAIGLSYLWASGYSNDMIIGGLLPFKDGFYYFYGAQLLSTGRLLVSNSIQSAWRPLYPGFISSLFLISHNNLQWGLALQVAALGTCCHLSAYLLRHSLGEIAAALYITFLYFYIQPMIGFVYSELLGLAIGCLGFILLWNSAKTKKVSQLIFGLAVLMVAVSVRAGTFFIFPMLVFWAAWVFRKKDCCYSFSVFAASLLTIVAVFLIVNSIYNHFVVEPNIAANGNFAFTIYGQVVGGAGYNLAIQRFGRNNPEIVYRAAWRFFQAHPMSLFIGAAKAYRDFFLTGIYEYYVPGGRKWWDMLLSIIWLAATMWGIVKSVRKIKSPVFSLALAAFMGFFLSIPFLPPRDGGVRFYASTVPFFFLLPTIAFESAATPNEKDNRLNLRLGQIATVISMLLLTLTILLPICTLQTNKSAVVDVPNCPVDQTPFAVQLNAGSFIDLVPNDNISCGHLPELCLNDFKTNSEMVDLSDFSVFQELIHQVQDSGQSIRVFSANEMINNVPGLFTGKSGELQKISNQSRITGCATKIAIAKRPDIYRIETFNQ